MKRLNITILMIALCYSASAQVNKKLQASVDRQVAEIEPKMIEWRRHFHEFPELSYQEFKTGETIADHLKALGLLVKTGVAHTGVVGLLDTGKPGPVIALRADIDALPVTERNNLPFASKVRTVYRWQETGVMHACGHDTHIAILMATAQILVENKSALRGKVKFILQPAEEGSPEGEVGGAGLMIKEDVHKDPAADVIFGLHIRSMAPIGTIEYRPGGFMLPVIGLP